MSTGVELIAAERVRQISEEGWTAEHDDAHTYGEMLVAAIAYSTIEQHRSYRRCSFKELAKYVCEMYWPWSSSWWKPSEDSVRNLVKAGALIAAEIDRLQRISK